MKKRLGCLHAHYSNIDYIETALSTYEIELIHFVEPGLLYQVTSNGAFTTEDAQKKVKDQLEWIALNDVDAILITCTNYIAFLQEEEIHLSLPIIKVDEPYFAYITNLEQPQTIVFSNPATVNGTIERLKQYECTHQKCMNIEVLVMNHAFELLMRGCIQEYKQAIIEVLTNSLEQEKTVSVAQLSMVDAAREVENMTGHIIINPLDMLITYLVNQLELNKKVK